MSELFGGILLLIQQFGLLAVVIAVIIVIAFMFSRTWTKSKDSRTNIQDNANKAQEIINNRVTSLELDRIKDVAAIAALQLDLGDTKENLRRARLSIVRLKEKVETLEQEKTSLATERNKLRAELDTTNVTLRDLERQVITLQAQLNAEQSAQLSTVKPILELLQRVIPPAPLPDTGNLSPAVDADTDPSAVHMGDTVTIAPAAPAA